MVNQGYLTEGQPLPESVLRAAAVHERERERKSQRQRIVWAGMTPTERAAFSARMRRYRTPESHHLGGLRRRARKVDAEGTFTAQEWRLLKARYRGRCAYCGKKPKVLTADHVVPLAGGGRHAIDNIVPACMPCNVRKGVRPAPAYQPLLSVLAGSGAVEAASEPRG